MASCGGNDDADGDTQPMPETGGAAGKSGAGGAAGKGGSAGAAGKGGSAGQAGAAGAAGSAGAAGGGAGDGGASGDGGVAGEGGAAGAAGDAGAAGQGGAAGSAGDAGAAGQGGGGTLCTPGATKACYTGPAGTENVGLCHGGNSTCAADGSAWGACEGQVVPAAENCATSQDEDCDGQTPACGGPIVDLRADVNRNGTVDLADPTEDASEETWDGAHGAIVLANIDDDDSSCSKSGTDAQLAACNDASNTTIDGANDLLDLARLKTVPWPSAPANATGAISVDTGASKRVRMFKKSGSSFSVYTSGTALTSAELQAGVELGIEALDIVRDDTVWDGHVDVTLTVNPGSGSPVSDTVRMRVAPVLFRHHLDAPDVIYATALNESASTQFRADLSAAMTASGITKPLATFVNVQDQWTQDFFETAYMAMPASGGRQVIHVNFRSSNYTGKSLRSAGRVVFTALRGPDVAGAVQYDPAHNDNMDSLNSFGNLETIPPYGAFNMGRVVRGSASSFYPDPSFDRMIQAQGIDSGNASGIQDLVEIDTSFLLVGHIDETVSFTKSSQGTHGWEVLVADTTQGWNLLRGQCPNPTAPACKTTIFAGTGWQTTIGAVVNDTDIANANAWAVTEIDSQREQLKQATGIVDADFVSIPAVWWTQSNYLVAFVPGIVNGISLGDGHHGPPDPYGPVIGGQDIFVAATAGALTPIGVTAHWIEDWDLYHELDGEVHCGSNTKRVVPTNVAWWESGK